MELKEYQKQVINSLRKFLLSLSEQHHKFEQAMEVDADIARDFNFPQRAWESIGLTDYHSVRNGLGEPLPNVVFKIPTGGGKTFLACHSVDLVHRLYLHEQNGLVLWIVPTTQIYTQTLEALTDKNHPYRQLLDISSGGRTLILEKTDIFTRQDVDEHLCVLLLMLPSASRQTKETLRVFKDNSGYTSFFPAEDAYEAQAELLKQVPNLDTYGMKEGFWGQLPLTSLGNTLRILKPLIIVDEGHKAYSATARSTIYGFNPSFVLELTATPPLGVNKLANVSGRALNDAQMIKLDIHLINKTTANWKETLTDAVKFRESLATKAKEYEQNTNKYIRPIMLIQVERTGKDQRDAGFIHSEEVKEFLIKQCGIPERHIAIKSSDKDEIENIDLLASDCSIRYIITKQALQEGWDCPFAYVLCALTNSQSEVSMTQLIGRVLRQPYATKTGIKELDECYVYTCRLNTTQLVRGIKLNLEGEGLGDIAGRMVVDDGSSNDYGTIPTKTVTYKEEFKRFTGKMYLPIFAIKDREHWREVKYLTDVVSRIDWTQTNLEPLNSIVLENKKLDEERIGIGYGESGEVGGKEQELLSYESEIDRGFVARQLMEVIPNPWIAFEIGNQAVDMFLARNDKEVVAYNLVFIIEELKKLLFDQRDVLSEKVFRDLLQQEVIRFYLLSSIKGRLNPSLLPSSVVVRSQQPLLVDWHEPAKSLFEYTPIEDMNELERKVAVYLDGQQQLLWWYRNMAKAQYRIQGWKPNKVYPDFVATEADGNGSFDKVYVLESKGEHLEGNEDTSYKRSLLDLCSSLAVESDVTTLGMNTTELDFVFQMIDETTWQAQINELLQIDTTHEQRTD